MREFINKLPSIFPILGFVFLIGIFFYLIDSENSDLQNEIDNLNSEIEKQDSLNSSLYNSIEDYQKLLDTVKSGFVDCPPNLGYELNGRYLTSDEVFDLLLNAWTENDSLTFELTRQKNYLEYIRMNWGLEIEKTNNSYSIRPKKDSRISKNESKLHELEALISKIERNYPIKYKINHGDNYITIELLPNQLDTAMFLYPYFKDRIKKEKNGYSIIK